MIRRTLFITVLLAFVAGASSAQKCYPFDDPPEGAPTSKVLEMRYAGKDTTGMGKLDPTTVRIPDVEGLDTTYRSFVSDLGSYLYDNGYEWGSRTRYFQRIYFEPNGEAAYYLYQFRNNAPQGDRKELFEKLVEEYLEKNELGVNAEERFALCAPVVLQARDEDEKGNKEKDE